jgi:hypothetical protein
LERTKSCVAGILNETKLQYSPESFRGKGRFLIPGRFDRPESKENPEMLESLASGFPFHGNASTQHCMMLSRKA